MCHQSQQASEASGTQQLVGGIGHEVWLVAEREVSRTAVVCVRLGYNRSQALHMIVVAGLDV